MEYLKNYFAWERVIGLMKNNRRSMEERRRRDSREMSVFSHPAERRTLPERRRSRQRAMGQHPGA